MAKLVNMRGLQNFISDIRACQNKEAELKRVEKELAKIRAAFGEDKALSAYNKRKYVWKLLYIYMLGYDVEFGHKQACDLIPAVKYSEKQVGYMACSILLNESDEFLRLAINAIHMDLQSRNEAFQCLALCFVGNVGGIEMAEALTNDVLKILQSGAARPVVKKKAALCLLRLVRKTPADQQLVQADTFSPVLIKLLEERDLGVLICGVTLLLGLCARTGVAGYETCQGRLIKILERLVACKDITADYTYYGIPSPWLQCKTLRALQYFPVPDTAAMQKSLHDALQAMIASCGDGIKSNTNTNKSNAQHAILFEAISLCLHLDLHPDLLTTCVAALGKFLTVKEPNIKYLALENLARLALVPEIDEAVRNHLPTIVASLRDPDISIRKRALDLLFTMSDATNSTTTVEELVKYLTVADFSMREELVLKVAVLAEKFAPNVQWYVDIALELLERAGDFCSEDIWHRVVQLVTNNDAMQEYAAQNVVEVLKRGASHESLVCTAAYILGEYGKLIMARVPTVEMFQLLHERFPACKASTRGLLLTTYLKLYLMDPNNEKLKQKVSGVLQRYSRIMDPELQQRAVEYLVLMERPQEAAKNIVLPMPKWEERESTLLRRLQAAEGVDEDEVKPGSTPVAADEDLSSQPGSTKSGVTVDMQGDPYKVMSPRVEAPLSPAVSTPVAPATVVDLLGGDDILTGNGPLVSTQSDTPFSPAFAAATGPQAVSVASKPPSIDPLADLMGETTAPVLSPSASGMYGNGITSPNSMQSYPPAGVFPAAGPLSPTSSVSSPSVGAPSAPPPDYQILGDVNHWYNSLLNKERGILFEDNYLQVGLQSRYSQGSGELVLFLGNKDPNKPLQGLQLVVPPSPTLHTIVGVVPQQLPPKEQIQVAIQVTCLGPPTESPRLHLGYALAPYSVQQDLRLPVAIHKFLTPEPTISKETFFQQWKSYTAPPHKQQEMVERGTPLAPDNVLHMLRGIGFGVEHGYLDPSPHNEAGAATFVSGAAPQQQSYLCLCRVEGNPQTRMQFRVTVAAPHPSLALVVKDMIVHLIKTGS